MMTLINYRLKVTLFVPNPSLPSFDSFVSCPSILPLLLADGFLLVWGTGMYTGTMDEV